MTGRGEVDARLREYLGQVAGNLDGVPEVERAEILQSVEAHIRDALAERATGEPTPEDMEIVLAEMDPPEAYIRQVTPAHAAAHEPNRIRWQTKLLGVVWAIFFIGMGNAVAGFRGIFENMVPGPRALPALTLFTLGVPFVLWVVLGLVGGVGIVAKSLFVPAGTSRSIDRILLYVLFAIGALAVVSIMLPIVRLQRDLAGMRTT
ncbi:MAG: HAAS signaling domain-containing protein [Planctomycetota bacterium]